MKKLFFDVETTGLDYRRNATHQLSVIVDIDNEVIEEVDFKIKPFENAVIEQTALDVGKVTKEQIMKYSNEEEIYEQFILLLEKYVDRYNRYDKFFLIGYNNASFDNRFLRALFERNDDVYFGSWFWANPIDVYVLASYYKMKEREDFPNFKLMTAAKAYGIEIKEADLHDALYDVKITRELFYKLKLVRYKNATNN